MKESWKPGTLIYPLPAVLVSCGATPDEYNLQTVPVHATVSRFQLSGASPHPTSTAGSG